jgi:hypothetical protein
MDAKKLKNRFQFNAGAVHDPRFEVVCISDTTPPVDGKPKADKSEWVSHFMRSIAVVRLDGADAILGEPIAFDLMPGQKKPLGIFVHGTTACPEGMLEKLPDFQPIADTRSLSSGELERYLGRKAALRSAHYWNGQTALMREDRISYDLRLIANQLESTPNVSGAVSVNKKDIGIFIMGDPLQSLVLLFDNDKRSFPYKKLGEQAGALVPTILANYRKRPKALPKGIAQVGDNYVIGAR